MRGHLSDSSVPDLCRGLSDAHATGALEIESELGTARIFFRSGFVYWAMSPAPRAQLGSRLVNADFVTAEQLEQTLERQRRTDRRTKLGALLVDEGLVTQDVIRVFVQEQILDALLDILRWERGVYSFHAGDAVAESLPVDIPVAQLLVAVARRQSEWDQVQHVIPDLDAVPDHVTGRGGMSTSLEPDEFAVLASIDGTRSVRELAADLGYSEFEAARIVYGLTLLGAVEILPDDDVDTQEELQRAAVEASAGDLEVELESAEDVEPPEDFDIGAALEEALAPPPYRPEPDRPAASAAEPEEPEPWVPTDLPEIAQPEQAVEPEPAPPEVGAPERVEEPGPQPAMASDVELSEGFEDLFAEVGEDDFDQLDDLEDVAAAEPEPTVAESAAATSEPADEPASEEPAPAEEPAEEAPEAEAPTEPSEPSAPRSAAQVSELLRELSRLTLEDEENDDDEAEPPRRRVSKTPPEPSEDQGKKRRLFGWGS
ncbi:MAG: DUF4388 domain-containing protein [Actinobacteria bacterium]|nr:DUF4388 domain-containing protein [Actinomycetota bacterium]